MALLRGLEGHAAPEDLFTTLPGTGPEPAGCMPSSASRPSRISRRPLTMAASSTSPASGHGGCTRSKRYWQNASVARHVGREQTRAPSSRHPARSPRPCRRAWFPAWRACSRSTPLAHQLGTTRDWVIIYYERDGASGQCTIVTERRGPLAGRRVVRGRDVECGRWMESSAPERSPGQPATSEARAEDSTARGSPERIHSLA
jgi:hypothetical protein